MSLVQLQRAGILKYLISQNTDGLHRRSGMDPECLSELHGNTNLEICETCGKEFMRDYHTRAAHAVHDHITGRICNEPECQGRLNDSIINFGEDLPVVPLEKAEYHSRQADLCLSMGSSLRVTPAANMPENVAQRGKRLVVVNLQSTPLDDLAALRIGAKCDDVIAEVMRVLEMDIPTFKLYRQVRVTMDDEGRRLTVDSVDVDGRPLSLFTRVAVAGHELKREPFCLSLKSPLPEEVVQVPIQLEFQGHYDEPDLTVNVPVSPGCSLMYAMYYNPMTGVWDEPVRSDVMAVDEPEQKED